MGLKIVGAGFGRTGTLSLKNALEKVGYGPCYHMLEVFPRPDHVALWHNAAFGKPVDWDLLFRGFDASPQLVDLQRDGFRRQATGGIQRRAEARRLLSRIRFNLKESLTWQ